MKREYIKVISDETISEKISEDFKNIDYNKIKNSHGNFLLCIVFIKQNYKG